MTPPLSAPSTLLFGVTSEGEEVLLDMETCELSISIMIDGIRIGGKTERYHNLLVLSADLACRIGLREARAFLERNQVPAKSPLWDLNHSR